jgi:predicted transcriptional regulator
MVTKYMFDKVRKLISEGLSDSKIALELNINRKTVAKYRKSNTPPSYSPRSAATRIDLFAPFAEMTRSLLAKNNDLTASEIFVLLQQEGYQGSERTVQRRMAYVCPLANNLTPLLPKT